MYKPRISAQGKSFLIFDYFLKVIDQLLTYAVLFWSIPSIDNCGVPIPPEKEFLHLKFGS